MLREKKFFGAYFIRLVVKVWRKANIPYGEQTLWGAYWASSCNRRSTRVLVKPDTWDWTRRYQYPARAR